MQCVGQDEMTQFTTTCLAVSTPACAFTLGDSGRRITLQHTTGVMRERQVECLTHSICLHLKRHSSPLPFTGGIASLGINREKHMFIF